MQKSLSEEIKTSSPLLKPALIEMLGRLNSSFQVPKILKASSQSPGSCTVNAVAYPFSNGSGAKAFASASCANLINVAGAGATANGYPLQIGYTRQMNGASRSASATGPGPCASTGTAWVEGALGDPSSFMANGDC